MALCSHPPVNSAMFHDRKGVRRGGKNKIQANPSPRGVDSQQKSLFPCETLLDFELELISNTSVTQDLHSPNHSVLNIATRSLKAVRLL